MGRLRTLFVGAGLAAALAAPASVPAATDVERARELATSGHRDDAIRLLEVRLSQDATDTDALTLLGTVLSWEGRYDEARTQLETVVATNPTHGDALPALINVELWSDHPERAESLAATGLEASPDDVTLLTAHARALHAMGRRQEAMKDCEHVLRLDPENKVARDLRERIRAGGVRWKAAAIYTYDHLSPDGDDWHEGELYLSRRLPFGSLIGRVSHARRFGIDDNQLELEAYPRIRPGTYAWVDAGWSPQANLYPHYRLGFDIYQSLPAGWEISLGYRRLGFDDPVNIYVGSLGKYWRSWLFSGRVFVTPGVAGTSTTYSVAARQYFRDGLGYYGFRYGWGRSPEEIRDLNTLAILHSQTLGAELAFPLPRGWEIDGRVSYGEEDRVSRGGLHHLSATVGVYYSF